jgi:glycosyltransferase involved in cell wall biosynthesis
MNKLKIAIIHDAAIEYSGGEKVIESLCKAFPHADLYTSYINHDKLKNSGVLRRIQTTWLQKISIVKRWPRMIQLLAPFTWPTLRLDHYDIILTHGGFYLSEIAHAVTTQRQAVHIHYSITPPYNLYSKRYQQPQEKTFAIFWYQLLRYIDMKAMQKVDTIWAVSEFISHRIQLTYTRDAIVVHPPISMPSIDQTKRHAARQAYCYVGRLEKDKSVDLIVRAFNENKLPLIIAGRGKQEQELKKMSQPNIRFTGFLELNDISGILRTSKAFIHAAKDDPFPLAPIEAMSYGTPVIAYHSGGLKEMVLEKRTGLFFYNHSSRALVQVIKKFEGMQFDPQTCYRQTTKYSEERFIHKVRLLTQESYEKYNKR